VNDAANVLLGVIAVATLIIAVVQVGVLVVVGLLARRLDRFARTLEHDIRPVIGHINAIGRDVARAAALATVQVERADRLFADLNGRVEQGLDNVRQAVARPAREGVALLSAFQAALAAFRNPPPSPRGRARGDDEDALFI
jgi:hypothetical protein